MRKSVNASAICLMVLFCGLTLSRAQSIAPLDKGFTTLITGTVWQVQNPPDPAMGMPSVLTPVEGCAVYVEQNEVMTLVPIKGETDEKGVFAIQLPSLSAGTIVVLRAVNGERTTEAKIILAGLAVETLDLYFHQTADTIIPPDLSGSATLYGTVQMADGTPAAGAKLYLYPLVNGDVAIDPEKPILDPGFGGGYTAVADEKGRFEIASIAIWNMVTIAIYPPVPAGDHFMLYAEKDGQSTQQKVFLSDGDSLGLKVQLAKVVVDPPVEGYAALKGRVVREGRTTSGTALLTPVAKCTVMVSARYMPMLESVKGNDAPIASEPVYCAVTDEQGLFAIEKIHLWAGKVEMVVMAQKDGLFGTSDVVLVVNQTGVVDVVLSMKPWVVIDPTPDEPGDSAVIMSPEAEFYAKNLDKVTATVKPGQAVGLSSRVFAVNVAAQTLRLSLAGEQRVSVIAYGLNGRRIATLASGRMQAGLNLLDLSGLRTSRAAGMVVLRITGEHFSTSVRLNRF